MKSKIGTVIAQVIITVATVLALALHFTTKKSETKEGPVTYRIHFQDTTYTASSFSNAGSLIEFTTTDGREFKACGTYIVETIK